MPSHAAMLDKIITVSPDQEVEAVLSLMKKEKVEAVPVIDEGRKVLGLFSLRVLMKNLLPVSVSMADGMQMDVALSAAPGVAKRLKKVGPLKVSDIMDANPVFVRPETQLWEAVRLIMQHGSPLLVIDGESQILAGVITAQSALDELYRMQG